MVPWKPPWRAVLAPSRAFGVSQRSHWFNKIAVSVDRRRQRGAVGVDEMILVSTAFDPAVRQRSYRLAADALGLREPLALAGD
jgi:hypothetical protein